MSRWWRFVGFSAISARKDSGQFNHWLGLCAGQRVRFRHPYDEGTATVMWTQVLGQKAESGFLIGESTW